MKFLFVLLNILLLQKFFFAQKADPSKYAVIVNAASLKKQLTIIASDSMEGRETGTAGQRRAAAYIEQQFKNIGLQPAKALNGYQQFYPVKVEAVTEVSLSVGNEKGIWENDFISPVGSNENASFTGKEIVFAGYGIDDDLYNDYENKDVNGKVVLFILGEPQKKEKYFLTADGKESPWSKRGSGITKKLETAASKGAVGALIIDLNQKSFSQSYIIRAKKSSSFNAADNDDSKKINYATLSHEFARKIIGADFENIISNANNKSRLNEIALSLNTPVLYKYSKSSDVVNASNILGIIEGTDKKNEYVFLTAHYDHLGIQNGQIYNGADDDGSGTATVIQMAAAFAKAKKEGNGPRRTIVFMTVSGEEKGLWGSEYYTDNPVFPLEKTSVDLNTDMIGRVDTERKTSDTLNYVYVVGHDKLSSELPVINETANNKNTKLVLDYMFDDPNDPNRIYYRSDHYNFARKGVPVLFFYDGMLQADYHKPTDDVELINWPLFEKRAQMIFYTAWEMANRNDMLKRDKPL